MINFNLYKNSRAYLMCLLFVLTGCSNSRLTVTRDIIAVKLTVNYPMVNPETGSLENLKDTIPIYYRGADVLYLIPKRKTFEKNGQLHSKETIFRYYLFSKDSSLGYYYDSVTGVPTKTPVDSMLYKRGYAARFTAAGKTLIDSSRHPINENIVVEKYTPLNVGSENVYDSAIYYYNEKLNHVPHSFSAELDNKTGKKLFMAIFKFNEKFSPAFKFQLPERELSYKITEIQLSKTEYESITQIFNQLNSKRF